MLFGEIAAGSNWRLWGVGPSPCEERSLPWIPIQLWPPRLKTMPRGRSLAIKRSKGVGIGLAREQCQHEDP